MGMIEGSSGGRKLAVDLNLVPFIDLMSILVIFLLLTAVWIQSSMLNIDSSVYGKKNSDFTPPPKSQIKKDVPFVLSIVPQGYRVAFAGKKMLIQKTARGYNSEELLEVLTGFKAQNPKKEDVVLSVSDQLPYSEMISGIDVLLSAGFPKISVATAGDL